MAPKTEFRQLARRGHSVFSQRRLREATLVGLSILLPIVVVGIALGMVLRYHPASGWLVPGIAALAVVLGGVALFRHRSREALDYPQFLRRLETKLDLGRNELINADELEERIPQMDDSLSQGLAAQAVEAGTRRVRQVPFAELAPTQSLKIPFLRSTFAVAVAAVLFGLFPTSFQSSFARILDPGSYDLPPAVWISVEPGNTTVQRGQSLSIEASLPSDRADARLYWRSGAGAWKSKPMVEFLQPTLPGQGGASEPLDGESLDREATASDGAPRFSDGEPRSSFRVSLRSLAEDTEYAVGSGTDRSDGYQIAVVEPLRALGYRKNITPPAYTKMPATQDLSSNGNLSAVVGSTVKLGIQTGRENTSGYLRLSEAETVPLIEMDDGLLVAEMRVSESLDYTVELSASDLPDTKWNSRRFRMEAVPDRPATLYQLAPETTVELSEDMRVTIDADCLDDFGLTRMVLVYQRNDRAVERETLATWKGEREARVVHDWDLEGIALSPGDVVRFHLELYDNDLVAGPKRTRGPNCEVRFPSLEEMYTQLEDDRDGQLSNLEKMKSDQAELKDELEKALTDLKQQNELDWEDQESLKDLAKRQEEVTKKLEDLAKSLDDSVKDMQQAELFSPEILQKVQEISELVKKLENEDFKKQMDQLQKSLDQVDKDAVEKALEQMQMSQQDLEQSLDRTLELLKKMKTEERLDQMVQDAKRLLEQQKRINEQLARGEVPPEMADRLKKNDLQSSERPEGGTPPEEPKDSEEQDAEQSERAKSEQAEAEESDAEKSDAEKSDVENQDESADESDADADKAEESGEESDEKSDQADAESDEESGEENSDEESGSEKSDQADAEESDSEQQDSEQSDQANSEQNESPPDESPSPSSESPLSEEESEELKKDQDELREELKKLQEELAELQKDAEESWEQLDEKLKEEKPKEKLQSAEQNMDQASKQMSEQKKEDSLEFGRQAEQDLEEFAEQMQQAQESLAEQETEDITRELYIISNQLVTVSQKQESLLQVSPSQSTRELAASQQRIAQAAQTTLLRLNELGQRSQLLSPDLTRAMNGAVANLQGSTRAFEKGNRQNAVVKGKGATNTLNETVVELLDANNEMCNKPSGGMCSNPMGKMRSLSSSQEQLNQDSKSQQGKGQGQGQSQKLQPGQSSGGQLADMAARQEMIQRGLSEVQESLGDRGDVLGRLDELAEEMADLAEEMREKGEIDDRILERQQKILSRLLTAQKSIRREDEKEQRTAKTGENPGDRESPAPLTEGLTQKELLKRGILRGRQDPVPDEFRSLVEDYFQSLSEAR